MGTLIEDLKTGGVVAKNLETLVGVLKKSDEGYGNVYIDRNDVSGRVWDPASDSSIRIVLESIDHFIDSVGETGDVGGRMKRLSDALHDLGL